VSTWWPAGPGYVYVIIGLGAANLAFTAGFAWWVKRAGGGQR
jgi:hypothetical protein